MSWRTVVIQSRCKLDLKLGFMVVRSEEIKRICLDEISVIIIENTAVSVTSCLLNELMKRKIKVIFCDEYHNPSSELMSYYGSHDTAVKLRCQTRWSEYIKQAVWTCIVTEKIRKQMQLLYRLGMNERADLLNGYIDEIEFNDETNREGHAAKVYFNALFGKEFSRNADIAINAALNYGYSILLSYINREITSHGYITQLGLFHDNMFNNFNFGSDLMEPFRPIIDEFVYNKKYNIFEREQKHEVLKIFESTVTVNGQVQYLPNAITLYCRSVFEALNENNPDVIKTYEVDM